MSSEKDYWTQHKNLEVLKSRLYHLIEVAIKLDVKNCIACEHFDEASEVCKKYGQRPPARIIAMGCPDFENNDDIPF